MLGVSFKKFKSNSVQPYGQEDLKVISTQPMTGYLQKKISSIKTKRLIQQFRGLKIKPLFHSDELLKSPKKSLTMPSLADNKDTLMTRALPSLPSDDSMTSGLTRASTWVGKSIRNLLKPGSSHNTIDTCSNEIFIYSKTPSMEDAQKRMTLHCKILQITNLSSSKAFPYTLSLKVSDNDPQTYSGVMKRVARGVSTSNPHCTLSFSIQGRFQLDCHLNIQASPTTLVGRLKQTAHETSEAHLQLDSGENPFCGFANKGIGRYAIQTTHPSLALEISISFWLEEGRPEPSSLDRDVLMFCQGGDYLTFYIKGESYPTWVRYWVTFEKNQLLLRLNERRGKPIERIPIENLTEVNISPSDDIQEEIYLGKKHGIILSFDHNRVIYLFADSSKSVRYWQSLLNAFLTIECVDSPLDIKKKYIWNTTN